MRDFGELFWKRGAEGGVVLIAVSNGQAPSEMPWSERNVSRTADEISSAALRL